MTRSPLRPRKQRTREHIIADQSVNYVEKFIIDKGHSAERLKNDYGYDLIMMTYDEQGYVEGGLVYLQLKASDSFQEQGGGYPFDLDIRDYNLWRQEQMPVFLVLYDAPRRRAFWLHVQRYFEDNPSRRPRKGAKTVRIHIGPRQRLSRRAVAMMRRRKEKTMTRFVVRS